MDVDNSAKAEAFPCMSLLCLRLMVGTPHPASAREEIRAAVAANFMTPFNEIPTMFEKATGIHVEPVFSSTGKINAQIVEGAPYDVFLSADERRPLDLNRKGLSGKPFAYSKGRVVLWAAKKAPCRENDWKAVVSGARTKRTAIANIETTPYGTAAMIALTDAKVWDRIRARLAFLHTIGEFGVILMVGGSIAGKTKVASIAIFEAAEALRYDAWLMSLALVPVNYVFQLLVYRLTPEARHGA